MTRLIDPDSTFEIIGAAMEVHRVLGPAGLLINFAKPSLEHKRIILKDSLLLSIRCIPDPSGRSNPLNPL